MSGSASVFAACFAVTVGIEGGYVDNPSDPGGATKYGISQRAYPTLDIANLTLADAESLYQRDYWAKAGCDLCPPALACLVFDAAVNNGPGAAVKWLQSAVGVTADGVIGPATRAAIPKSDNVAALAAFHGARIQAMAAMSDWATFGKGWARRLAQVPYQAAQVAASAGSLPQLTLA